MSDFSRRITSLEFMASVLESLQNLKSNALRLDLSLSERVVHWALLAYLVLQNVLKWYPFQEGRSANDLIKLQDNYPSIFASLLLFGLVLFFLGKDFLKSYRWSWLDSLPVGFMGFLVLQIAFREHKAREAVRSMALLGSLGSALIFGWYFSRSAERLNGILGTLKIGLVLSFLIGFVVSLIKPQSVHWGSLSQVQCIGTMPCRAEFFFLTMTPVFAIILLLKGPFGNSVQRYVSSIFAALISVIAFMTRTRQFMLSIATSLLMHFGLQIQNKKRALSFVFLLGVIGLLFEGIFFRRLLEYLRIIPEPAALQIEPSSADWSSGRFQLLNFLWDKFTEAPWVGLGGDHVRELIAHAPLAAKTEHGFALYIAAYGIFGFLFIGFIVAAAMWGAKYYIEAFTNEPSEVQTLNPLATVALISLPLFAFGFFGVFGSATNPNDWLCLAMASVMFFGRRASSLR